MGPAHSFVTHKRQEAKLENRVRFENDPSQTSDNVQYIGAVQIMIRLQINNDDPRENNYPSCQTVAHPKVIINFPRHDQLHCKGHKRKNDQGCPHLNINHPNSLESVVH